MLEQQWTGRPLVRCTPRASGAGGGGGGSQRQSPTLTLARLGQAPASHLQPLSRRLEAPLPAGRLGARLRRARLWGRADPLESHLEGESVPHNGLIGRAGPQSGRRDRAWAMRAASHFGMPAPLLPNHNTCPDRSVPQRAPASPSTRATANFLRLGGAVHAFALTSMADDPGPSVLDEQQGAGGLQLPASREKHVFKAPAPRQSLLGEAGPLQEAAGSCRRRPGACSSCYRAPPPLTAACPSSRPCCRPGQARGSEARRAGQAGRHGARWVVAARPGPPSCCRRRPSPAAGCLLVCARPTAAAVQPRCQQLSPTLPPYPFPLQASARCCH